VKIHGNEAIHCDDDLETLEVLRVEDPQRYSRAAVIETYGPLTDQRGQVIIGDADLTGLLVHIINPVVDLPSIGLRLFNADGMTYLETDSEAPMTALTGDDARALAAALLQAADVTDGITDDPIDTAWNPQVTG